MIQVLLGSLLLSVIHALIPNHWLPIVAVSKAQQWTRTETSTWPRCPGARTDRGWSRPGRRAASESWFGCVDFSRIWIFGYLTTKDTKGTELWGHPFVSFVRFVVIERIPIDSAASHEALQIHGLPSTGGVLQ